MQVGGQSNVIDQLTVREIEVLERLASGLTDQEIAIDLYLSLNTIKWYNRQIYSKLGVSSRTQAVTFAQKSNLLTTEPAPSQSSVPSHNLPAQTTEFIGRVRETEEVKQLLRSARLLTLTGPGGTGKTRLALQVTAAMVDIFADGACFVDLAPLSDHVLVAKTIAGVLDVFENPGEPLPDTLKRALAERELLLLIDNFEHVIGAAPFLSDLLSAVSRLKILVTSREPLHISGEQEYPVPALSLPSPDNISAQSLLDSEAGLLFIQRARMTLPHFQMNDENVMAIAEICYRLDGLPLAIELAAARCKLLSPRALLARLDGTQNEPALGVLTHGTRDAPPRHRTLRDSIEWSYQLLNEDEKTLFARLAVFRGSRSLEAIQAVCSKDLSIDVFDGLASLIDKNLVRQKEEPNTEPRFALLEMIQEYAIERLEASSEVEKMRRRHAAYYVALAERAEPELRLAKYDYWSHVFEVEVDNIRAVLKWSLNGGNLVQGVRLASALGQFWYGKGHHIEGYQWTEQLLARINEVPIAYHPKLLFSAGHMTFLQNLDTAQPLFQRALVVSRQLGDKLQTAWALTFLGYTMLRDLDMAMPLAEEGLALFRHLKYQPGIAQTLNVMGEIARFNGDDARAKRVYEECLAVSQQTGEKRRICYTWQNLSLIAQHKDNHEYALDLAYRALQLAQEMQSRIEMATSLEVIAGSIVALGQPQRAVRLLGASDSVHKRLGAFHQPSNQFETDRVVIEARSYLDDQTFQTAWVEGYALTLEQAVRDVLSTAPS